MEIDYDSLYCRINDFCKGFELWYQKQLLAEGKIKRKRDCCLSLSEMHLILKVYHSSEMTCFKYFYLDLLRNHIDLFPNLVHYDRFVKFIKRAFPALVCFLKSLEGSVSNYLFIDSTPMAVCHNFREERHKIFNTKGEIVRLRITRGTTHDRSPVLEMVKGIKAKLIGDKGYLSQNPFEKLFEQGVTLITKVKKNIKNRLMDMTDKLMLMKDLLLKQSFLQ